MGPDGKFSWGRSWSCGFLYRFVLVARWEPWQKSSWDDALFVWFLLPLGAVGHCSIGKVLMGWGIVYVVSFTMLCIFGIVGILGFFFAFRAFWTFVVFSYFAIFVSSFYSLRGFAFGIFNSGKLRFVVFVCHFILCSMATLIFIVIDRFQVWNRIWEFANINWMRRCSLFMSLLKN